MFIFISLLILLALSALFSGLTIGLMGLDVYVLRRKIKNGNKDALKVYEVRKDGTLLLTTLLLGNVAVNAVISIILGQLLGGVLAGFVATAIIFILCEIIPQAVMSRHALHIGARLAWLVRIFIFILYPICQPLSWILDRFLGHELPHHMSKRELISIIDEYESHLPESAIDRDEQRIAHGSLTYSQRIVSDVMTPAVVVQTLELGQVLDEATLTSLKDSGFSRFPVYDKDKNNMLGILYFRDLLGVAVNTPVKDIYDPYVYFVEPEEKLDTVLNMFIEKKVHLFVVRTQFGTFEGVISMEDILEEIVGTEIMDEGDHHADLRRLAKTIIHNRTKK